MPKSTATRNSFLALLYNATPWANVADNAGAAPATVVQVPLATASYTAASALNAAEATYTNYVRQTVARTAGGWATPAAGVTSNVAAIEYPQCGVTGNTLTSAATGTGAGAGIIWHFGDLNATIVVSNQIQPRFPIGAVTITET